MYIVLLYFTMPNMFIVQVCMYMYIIRLRYFGKDTINQRSRELLEQLCLDLVFKQA